MHRLSGRTPLEEPIALFTCLLSQVVQTGRVPFHSDLVRTMHIFSFSFLFA